ncbi:MAG: cytochrome-c peroxidase [Deltaproteobacteria bacterium]|nr:cytochrome-c peroxidase [Deltaproteobacteria bacterium]
MANAKYPTSAAKVALGHQLFFDKRLSKNHDISCNSCHGVTTHGVDNQPTSLGHKGQRGGRNSPTVMNAALHVAQFWDGREPDVEAQAKGPVMNPVEMAMPDAKRVEATLNSMPEYVTSFKKAFPDDKSPVSFDNMALAIGAYERKLVTPSAFDAYLKGDDKALNDAQKEGLSTFLAVGCQACHSGVGVGGGMFQKLGLLKEWPSKDDLGRFAHTKKDADKMFFKVPTLRNIEKTHPYFHDGKVASLEEAVKLMGEYQLGKKLDDKQVKSIVTFLGSLTGTPAAEFMKEPALPKSTKTTPKADPS